MLLVPQPTGERVEGHPKAVAHPVRKHLLDVGAHLTAQCSAGGEEGVIRGGTAIVIEPQDGAREVSGIRLRAAKLIVGDDRTGTDTVVMTGRYTGTYKSTGRPINAQVAHFWTLEGGKVVQFQQLVDTLAVARATGAV